MPPQTQSPIAPAQISETCKWYSPLCKVTTTSKILAAVVFIVLPFIGGYVGYQISLNTDPVVSITSVETEDNFNNISGISFSRLRDSQTIPAEYLIEDNLIFCIGNAEALSIPYSDDVMISEQIDFRYLVVGSKLYWECREIGNIDRASLKLVNEISSDIQDNTSVYFSGKKITDADGLSFKPIIFTGPNRHQSSVAYMTRYYTDAQKVFYIHADKIVVLEEANPREFKVLDSGPTMGYGSDNNAVYYNGDKILASNPKDFEIVEGLGMDGLALYADGEKIVDNVSKSDIKMYLSEYGKLGGSPDILIYITDINMWYALKEEIDNEGSQIKVLVSIAKPLSNSIGEQFYPYTN